MLDDAGCIGQTTHVGPWSAEVILITDPEHAVPVRIERTGLRTIAVGAGDTGSLALPYLPANADVKAGDLLVTSGLGGVFPAGYPVARVTEVHRDAVQPLAQVRAAPLAHVDTDPRWCWCGSGPIIPPPGRPPPTPRRAQAGNPATCSRAGTSQAGAPPQPATPRRQAPAEPPAQTTTPRPHRPPSRAATARRSASPRQRRHDARVAPAHAAHGARGADSHGVAAAAVARRAAARISWC